MVAKRLQEQQAPHNELNWAIASILPYIDFGGLSMDFVVVLFPFDVGLGVDVCFGFEPDLVEEPLDPLQPPRSKRIPTRNSLYSQS